MSVQKDLSLKAINTLAEPLKLDVYEAAAGIMDIAAVIIIFILLIPWFPFEDNYIRYGALGFTGFSIFLIFAEE